MTLSLLPALSAADLDAEIARPARLVLGSARHRRSDLVEACAPFDHVNPAARIAIVGLTPGRQQAGLALHAARRALIAGHDEGAVLALAKVHASFGGAMRGNLVALLDDLGLHRRLGIASCAALWGAASGLAHFTSALRYPVYRNGENYSGAPDPLAVPLLRSRIETTLAEEIALLGPDAILVPLGPVATKALRHAAALAGIDPGRILVGLPHPSGANAERIAVFRGTKPPAAASSRTDPARLLAARAALVAQLEGL